MSNRIPVYAGPRIIEMCDEVSVRRYLSAPNAEVIRKRKTGAIVQVNLRALSDDSNDSNCKSVAGGRALIYEESLSDGNARLVVLKRYDRETGSFVYWSSTDGFNPFRFNPDATSGSSTMTSRPATKDSPGQSAAPSPMLVPAKPSSRPN